MTPKERAEKAAEVMWRDDRASSWLGMTVVDVDEGYAVLELVVSENHVNGHGICHGGIIYGLADSAFAFACNLRNQSTVAQHNSITYLAPAQTGDRLTATAHEESLVGRNGITDVIVINQAGKKIAMFRGMSRTIQGQLFSEETVS